jgi:hypothetical protein
MHSILQIRYHLLTVQALVDIPIVMNSMPPAIKLAVVQSRS